MEFARYKQVDLGKFRPSASSGYPNGRDNLFPDYLDGLFNASPTHAGIIKDLSSYIVGKGLKSDDPQSQIKIDRFFPKKKLTKIIELDNIHNVKALEILKDAVYNISEINIVLPKQIRVTKIADGNPVEFKYRQSWNKDNYYAYQIEDHFVSYKKNIQLRKSLFYSYDSQTFPVPYGRPYYMSGLNAIEMEAGIYLMHNHGVQQGMMPSIIFDLIQSGDEEQDRKTAMQIVQQMSGAANAGKPIIVNRPQGSDPIGINVPSTPGIDKVYNTQYETSEAGISKAHGLPSSTLIAGLNIKPTGFSDASEEMQWALNQWRQKKIEPYRRDFLDDLKPLFEDLGIVGAYFEDEVDQNQELTYSYDSEKLDTPNVNSVITSLTGRQLQNIERVVRKFKKGAMDYQQAAILLKSGYGFTDEEVREWLKNTEEFKAKMSRNDDLQILINKGETEADLEGYEIYSIEDAGTSFEEEDKFLSTQKFVSTGTARPNSKSEQDGTKGDVQYKIRYKYEGNRPAQREFCQRMLAANKIYRYEDIRNMSFSNVNPGFGKGGANNYDIFSFKGGPNCRHLWKRYTYVKKGLDGGIDARNPNAIITETEADRRGIVPTGTAKTKDRISQQKPFNMPKRGYFSSFKQWFSDAFKR